MLVDCLHCGTPSVTGYCSTHCRTTASGDTMRQDMHIPQPDTQYRWAYGDKLWSTIHHGTCSHAKYPIPHIDDWTEQDLVDWCDDVSYIKTCDDCFNGEG